ncbi:MAG: hypothetical protein GY749_19480, partial [Desulfobacteraceae bacterium]|nr:hypothetical protein [Desulfobacteraceae bacterium]
SAFVLKTGERTETSNCPLENVLVAEKNTVAESVEDGLLDDIFLKSYLMGEESVNYVKLSDYMVSEPKIGIRRNNITHSIKAGMLYRIEMKRLESAKKPGKKTQSISLFAEFEGLTLPEKGFLKLGGEGKSAYYSPSAAGLIDKLELGGNRFKLYLAAPAVFEKGWLPRMIDENTFTGKFNDLEFQLETAVIGKPLHIGGFDMKKKKPKPMRKAVPAGSIYFFTMIKGNIQAAVDAFHGRNISDYEPHQGFGLSFVGGWK